MGRPCRRARPGRSDPSRPPPHRRNLDDRLRLPPTCTCPAEDTRSPIPRNHPQISAYRPPPPRLSGKAGQRFPGELFPFWSPLVTEANPGRNAGRRADLVADQRSNSQKTTMPDETRVSSNIFAGCPKDLNWPGNTGVVLGAESGFPPYPSGYSSFGCAAIVSVWRSNGVEHHCDDIAWRGRRGADRVQGRI